MEWLEYFLNFERHWLGQSELPLDEAGVAVASIFTLKSSLCISVQFFAAFGVLLIRSIQEAHMS